MPKHHRSHIASAEALLRQGTAIDRSAQNVIAQRACMLSIQPESPATAAMQHVGSRLALRRMPSWLASMTTSTVKTILDHYGQAAVDG